MSKKIYDMDRLGGPPGLYDSPNRERESTGGIVQRVRVPDATAKELYYPIGPFQTLSLNDSDMVRDEMGGTENKPVAIKSEDLECGIPFRKSIAGDQM